MFSLIKTKLYNLQNNVRCLRLFTPLDSELHGETCQGICPYKQKMLISLTMKKLHTIAMATGAILFFSQYQQKAD